MLVTVFADGGSWTRAAAALAMCFGSAHGLDWLGHPTHRCGMMMSMHKTTNPVPTTCLQSLQRIVLVHADTTFFHLVETRQT